ncbi:hypothetical protein NA78x_001826 [Anatilimnocola sp. NA78]|uniref:hypothetical protein n=1 Tax=Anatilimnocola sp. NA78 TaxID=3415683 RepID=UPI003CE5B12A
MSEQIHLTHHGAREAWNSPEKIIGLVMAVLFILTFRSMLSGSEPGEAKLRGPLGIEPRWQDAACHALQPPRAQPSSNKFSVFQFA